MKLPLLLIFAIVGTLIACNDKTENSTSPVATLDVELRQLIKREQLTGTPQSNHPPVDIQTPIAQLGKKLFFSKILGGDKTTACATCHHPLLGGGDNLSLSIGTRSSHPAVIGQHRKIRFNGNPVVPRNAPTTFNVAFYRRVLFHDGRIERLDKYRIHTPDMPYPVDDPLAGETLVQAQARFPITSVEEMRGNFLAESHNQTVRRALAERLKSNWIEAFRVGFSSPEGTAEELITEQNFSEAIASYERSQIFINSPWKRYIEGDTTALSDKAKQGALLFFRTHKEGGANCASCHTGDFFTDELAHNTGMIQIGKGKEDGNSGSNDYGCQRVTGKENDKFRFRTPSLLNVAETGPWGHAGAYTSLEAITRHMLAPVESALTYDASQLHQQKIDTKAQESNTIEALKAGLDLQPTPFFSDKDVTFLVTFLKSLTDPCIKDRNCLLPWLPERYEDDPDGQTLHAINGATGDFL